MHILVADQDRLNVKLTTYLLESSGYSVTATHSAKEILSIVERGEPDLILLDVELPQTNGFDICRQIRQTSDIPVIFLSARAKLEDRVLGLQIGGDDYLSKPFEPVELLARIEVVLRRRDSDTVIPLTRINAADISLDPVEQRVTYLDGRTTILTPIEFRLLYYFVKNTDRILTSEQILDKVWRYEESNSSNLVAVYVRRLRNKIETDAKRPRYILTIPNRGYRFQSRYMDDIAA